MRLKLRQPGFWIAAALCLLFLALQVTASTPLQMLAAASKAWGAQHIGQRIAFSPWTMGLINFAAFAGVMWLALHLNKLPLKDAFDWPRPTPAQVAGLVIMTLGSVFLISEADNVLHRLIPVPQWFMDMMKEFTSGGDHAGRFFLLVIVAPVTEELLFRGIILRGLLARHSQFAAVLLTSLLFGFVHLNPWQFLTALVLGMLLGWVYLRTGSVFLCILGHAVVNGMFFLTTLVQDPIPGVTPTADASTSFQPWWLDVTGVALLIIGASLFKKATPVPPEDDPEDPPIISEYNAAIPPIIS